MEEYKRREPRIWVSSVNTWLFNVKRKRIGKSGLNPVYCLVSIVRYILYLYFQPLVQSMYLFNNICVIVPLLYNYFWYVMPFDPNRSGHIFLQCFKQVTNYLNVLEVNVL